jgi:hypothetical protein
MPGTIGKDGPMRLQEKPGPAISVVPKKQDRTHRTPVKNQEKTLAEYEDDIKKVFGDCGNPCVVTYNPGGNLKHFKAAGTALKELNRFSVFDGQCHSGCSVVADMVKDQACVTDRVVMGFHRGYVYDKVTEAGKVILKFRERFDQPQSPAIDAWVRSRPGGYPEDRMQLMRVKDAKKFWPVCQIRNVPKPRPRPATQVAHRRG